MGSQGQHTIPRFYLNRFLNPGWAYRRGALKPRRARDPNRISVRRDYYGRSEVKRHKALDEINKLAENEGALALKNLISNYTTLTSYDWIALSYLFANFAVRNPAAIDTMRTVFSSAAQQVKEMAHKMIEAYEKAKEEGKDLSGFSEPTLGDSPSYSLDEINSWAAELKTSNGNLVVAADMFSAMEDIAKCIQRMSYLILEAPAGLFFVTCDRPLILYSQRTRSTVGAGWGNTDALARIPLSPKYLLVIFYHTPKAIYEKRITASDVHLENINTMKFAVDEVYSPHKYREAEAWMCQAGQ